jgi:hypothetical protein
LVSSLVALNLHPAKCSQRCALAWFIAAFLPLPEKPDAVLDENGPELEMALKMRLHELGRRRYENARWWRNLNRWMTPLGLVIIAIVVSL